MRAFLLAALLLGCSAVGALAQPYSITVLGNGAQAGQLQGVPAGDYEIWASGTFGGATITLTGSAGGSTATLATVTGTASGTTRVCVAAGVAVQALVTGGTPAGLNLVLAGDGPCPGVASSGGSGGSVTLLSGSALAGRFGIDQTTPGTTNGVYVNNTVPVTTRVSISQSVTTVPAVTDTTVITTNATRRSLAVFVQTSSPACYLAFDTAAASGQGLLLGSGSMVGYGYAWDSGLAPTNAIHVFCNVAASVIVMEGN